MPVFGKSLFETVLDVLDQQEDQPEDENRSPRVRGFNGGFVGREWNTDSGAESHPSSLFDGFPLDPVAIVVEIPAWVGRLSESEIIEDLALALCRTEQDVRERRRSFAFENHPDRVTAEYRGQANLRMTVANRLIDKALQTFR